MEDDGGKLHMRNLSLHPVASEEEALNLVCSTHNLLHATTQERLCVQNVSRCYISACVGLDMEGMQGVLEARDACRAQECLCSCLSESRGCMPVAAVPGGDQSHHQRHAHERGVLPLALHFHASCRVPPGAPLLSAGSHPIIALMKAPSHNSFLCKLSCKDQGSLVVMHAQAVVLERQYCHMQC